MANVPQNCFIPRPNVGSAVIKLTLIHAGKTLEVGAAGAIVGVSAGTVLAMLYMIRDYRRGGVPAAPTATKTAIAVLKQRRIWVRRPVASASLMSLESARGRPAVESVRRKA